MELEERTGDIAHLETRRLFRFLFAMSSTFVFYSLSAVTVGLKVMGLTYETCCAFRRDITNPGA